MKPFKRTRHGWVWRCSPNEVQLLATLVEQFVDLIAPPPVAAVDDWMSLLQGEMETEPLDRGDPAIERLFPSAYRDDEQADDEYRSLTEASMRRAKADDAQVVLAALALAGDHVAIGPSEAGAWLRTTNSLRLVLAARLGITTAAQAEAVDDLVEEHPAFPAGEVYQWLGYVQTALLDAM